MRRDIFTAWVDPRGLKDIDGAVVQITIDGKKMPAQKIVDLVMALTNQGYEIDGINLEGTFDRVHFTEAKRAKKNETVTFPLDVESWTFLEVRRFERLLSQADPADVGGGAFIDKWLAYHGWKLISKKVKSEDVLPEDPRWTQIVNESPDAIFGRWHREVKSQMGLVDGAYETQFSKDLIKFFESDPLIDKVREQSLNTLYGRYGIYLARRGVFYGYKKDQFRKRLRRYFMSHEEKFIEHDGERILADVIYTDFVG